MIWTVSKLSSMFTPSEETEYTPNCQKQQAGCMYNKIKIKVPQIQTTLKHKYKIYRCEAKTVDMNIFIQ